MPTDNGGRVNVSPRLLKKVKDSVDLIYSLTNGEGYSGGWSRFGDTGFCRVATILVKRGVISKVHLGDGYKYLYRWIANSAPTKHFYRSIAEELFIRNTKSYSRRQRTNSEFSHHPFTSTPAKSLDGFTNQELWDELKRRGAQIINGELAIVTKLC